MALSFTDASTNNVNHGSSSELDNLQSGTIMTWIYLDDVANAYRDFIGKFDGTDGYHMFRIGTDGTTFRITKTRQNGPQRQYANSNSVLTANIWNFFGGGFSIPAGNPFNFWGDLTTRATDQTAAIQNGSGASGDDSGASFIVGDFEGNFAFPGDCAWVGLWDVKLTIKEIAAQQYNIWTPIVQPDNCILFSNYVHPASSIQTDWSSNQNNGVVTGATKTTHIPLADQLFQRRVWMIPPPAAAGGDVTVSPAAAKFALTSTDPTTVLGSVTITDTTEFALTSTDPTVILGDITITPAAAKLASTTTDPAVVLGDITITKTSQFALTTTDPAIVLGSVTISDTAEFALTTTDPTVDITGGSVTVTPTAAMLALTTTDPSLQFGSLTISDTAEFAMSTTDPTVSLTGGGATVTPAAAAFGLSTTDPAYTSKIPVFMRHYRNLRVR